VLNQICEYCIKQCNELHLHGILDLPNERKLILLPNNLVFIVDSNDKFIEHVIPGVGHEPNMINKLLTFINYGENYVEVGANYGDFVFQISLKVGEKGRVYAFEPGPQVYKLLQTSTTLNGLNNVILENLAVLEKTKEVSFIETHQIDSHGTLGSYVYEKKLTDNYKEDVFVRAISLDDYFNGIEENVHLVRLDAEGSECSIIIGSENLIKKSPDIRFFIEWQNDLITRTNPGVDKVKCLQFLTNKGFILLNSLEVSLCQYLDHILSIQFIINSSKNVEILAIRENTIKIFAKNASCGMCYLTD